VHNSADGQLLVSPEGVERSIDPGRPEPVSEFVPAWIAPDGKRFVGGLGHARRPTGPLGVPLTQGELTGDLAACGHPPRVT
jgi:hypothetical protein